MSLHIISEEHEKCEDPSSIIFFTVNHNAKNMDSYKADIFRATTAKALFI